MGSIVWLASYPRSGNTWTRSFLHCLLAVLRGEDPAALDINRMFQLTTWDVMPLWWREHLKKPLEEASPAEVAALRPRVQQYIAENADGAVFVKTHNALVLSNGYPTINLQVTSGAIYVVRNPLDAAISNAHHFGVEIDRAIEQLNCDGFQVPNHKNGAYEHYGAWWQHVESWTRKPHRTIYVMRYEDMLADPLATFGRLAAHLLLRPTPEQLQAAVAAADFQRLRQQEMEKGFRERPEASEVFFRGGRAGEWREVLSAAQVKAIVDKNRRWMERFGYLP